MCYPPESKKGVADENDGSGLMADCCAPADVLVIGDVAQAHKGEGKDETAQRRRREDKCQEEAVIPLQPRTHTGESWCRKTSLQAAAFTRVAALARKMEPLLTPPTICN